MRGNRSAKRRHEDWRASELVGALMADRGWSPADVYTASRSTGHPQRCVSVRSVYRVVSEGHIPTNAIQFEIAAVFGLLPSHIWGRTPMPEASTPSRAAVST